MRLKHIAVFVIAVASFGVLSAGEAYQLDASHTSVGFTVRHLSISNTKGTFPKVSGTLVLDESKIGQSSVEVTIDAASVDTNDDTRDEHLRGADFFDVAKTPSITFKSTKVVKSGNAYKATGDLTIKGVTKSVEIPFTMSPPTAKITSSPGSDCADHSNT